MKQPRDLARRFLALADRDIRTFRLLSDIPESDDEAVGFHAQQAVEKCLKAVLAQYRLEVQKTHDLRALLDLLVERNLPIPALAEELDSLSPFAVILRYDLAETGALDREQARTVVEQVRRWAEEQIK
jgi:HEPN domain-containing protein